MKKAILTCLFLVCLVAGWIIAQPTGHTVLPPAPPPAGAAEASAIPSSGDSAAPTAPMTAPPTAAPSSSLTAPPTAAPSPSLTPSVLPAAALPPEAFVLSDRLDAIFSASSEFYGSVLIVDDGRVLLSKGYGMSDVTLGRKNTPDTKFLIGSVTKQFTAMAVMQLYEKGLLDLRDTLSKYIPDFTRGGEITLQSLLTQTSGITDYMNDAPSVISQMPFTALSEENIIGQIKSKSLKFAPGARYSYSNSNFLILGYVVEKVSGMRLGAYFSRNIFKPLGMNNTGVFNIEHPPEQLAAGHSLYNAPFCFFTPEGDINPENARATASGYGAGCLYSTVGDLYLWDRALAANTLLSRKNMDMMLAPSVAVNNPEIKLAYGYGWVIEDDSDVGTVCRHTGILGGYKAYNGLFTDKGAVVIVLSNTMDYPGSDKLIRSVKQALKGS